MADFEVSISKTLSVRGTECHTLKYHLLTLQSLPFLTSNRKWFTYWHFKVCHSLPLTESVLLIDTSKSAIPYL
jgi:hypothetical protein